MDDHVTPTEEPVRSNHRPLIPLLAWGLSPAAMMTIAGIVSAARRKEDDLSTAFIFLCLWGGPVLLLGWSIWLVYPMKWTITRKVILVIPIVIAAYFVNIWIAAGACDVILPLFNDPPV